MLLDQLLFSDSTPKLLKKTLDLYLQKNSVISSNIANADTPGYKAVDLKFDEQLRTAIGSGNQIKVKATQRGHFTSDIKQIDKITPIVSEESDPARPDGNNVKIEKEMSKLVETQLMYILLSRQFQKEAAYFAMLLKKARDRKKVRL